MPLPEFARMHVQRSGSSAGKIFTSSAAVGPRESKTIGQKPKHESNSLRAKSFAAHFWIAGIVEFRSSLSEAIGEIPIECREQTFWVNKSLSRTIYNLSIDASRNSWDYKRLLFRALDDNA